MKKIMNQPETMVKEMCNGIAMAHPELEFINKYKIMKKNQINPNKVTLISGGGSGHEPAHAGFIGDGMLDVAICGDIFASPSQIQIYQGIKSSVSNKGTLLIIKNYSGDMMNFKNAAYLATEDGISVDYVKVEDDIAVEDSLYTVGRRGVAGTLFVHKIAGAAAESGKSLSEVKRIAQKAADNVRTIGFALSSCTVPAKGNPTFNLQDGEMEYGVGIHGEPGIRREKVVCADELANRMINQLLKDLKMKEEDSDEIAILINGFGATPLQELYLLNNSVHRVLSQKNCSIYQSFVGNYMTSIDMAGSSISILKLDDELKNYLATPCDSPAFKLSKHVKMNSFIEPIDTETASTKNLSNELKTSFSPTIINNTLTLGNLICIVDHMCDCIIANEVPFCELDSHAGDGDFGMSVAKGFRQLKAEWNSILSTKNLTIGSFLDTCSMIIMEHCGGASGPIWGSAFRAAGKSVGTANELSVAQFAIMMQTAVKGIQVTGARSFGRGAEIGDKTLIDALIPCADSWNDSVQNDLPFLTAFTNAAIAAVEGAKKTEELVARMGRAGTVGERSIGYPDAGAYALGVIFTEISNYLNQNN